MSADSFVLWSTILRLPCQTILQYKIEFYRQSLYFFVCRMRRSWINTYASFNLLCDLLQKRICAKFQDNRFIKNEMKWIKTRFQDNTDRKKRKIYYFFFYLIIFLSIIFYLKYLSDTILSSGIWQKFSVMLFNI